MKRTKSASPSHRRQRVFLAITLLFPFFFLLLLETGLRVVDYGGNLGLFQQEVIRGKAYYSLNPAVKNRYFGSVDFSPTISPDLFLVTKPDTTIRIFFLGGSTTVGYPYWYNGSFSSFLRERLRRMLPHLHIEVVNIGMTATNSYTVLDMAREVVAYGPDLLIVYDGHNEFYGALGIASNESLGGSRTLVHLYLRLLHWKTFLLVRNTITKAAGLIHGSSDRPNRTTLMETMARGNYIRYGSPRYTAALQNFQQNLEELIALCQSNNLPLILSTQVSNLKDQRPFISGPSHESKEAIEREELSRMTAQAFALYESGNLKAATEAAHRAIALDSAAADPRFVLGKTLAAAGRTREAWQEFKLARDYDQLRFRQSSDFNTMVHSLARPGVVVADAEEVFRAHSPDSLIGHELVTEHLHPNSRGFFLLGAEYARLIHENGFGFSQSEWKRRRVVSEEELWRDRPVTPLDERVAQRRTDVLTSGWPFIDQYPIVDAVSTTDTLGIIAERTTQGRLDWMAAHKTVAEFYEMKKDWKSAEAEYRTIVSQIPYNLEARLSLARSLFLQNRFRDMEPVLLSSLEIEPTIQACRTLGDIAMEQRNATGAIRYYDMMMSFPQSQSERVQNGLARATAYRAAGKLIEAKQQTLDVLKLAPDFQPAVELLLKLQNAE